MTKRGQGCLQASGVKDARGRRRDKEVIPKATKVEKEEATITGAKLKEKERGRRSWAAGAQTLVKCAHMVGNFAGRGRTTTPAGPQWNLAEDL
jgi:hypothetical protein